MVNKKVKPSNIVESPVITGNEHERWFEENIQNYKSLAQIIAATLKITLDGHKISYVDIPFREKSKKSYLKKLNDKNKVKSYSPLDMTDLAGIRVITLIESDVHKVCSLIKSLFNVHQKDSVNKSENLGDDKVGYRSIHFVCDIGETRENLIEWNALKGLKFEIQVRTALEHAWAEIEHDRGYKLGGKLPSHLTRRFSLLSGLLESADLEFNRLTIEIEDYAKTLKNNIENNQSLDIELTTVGVKTLLNHIFSDIKYTERGENNLNNALKDVKNFGISNLNELKSVLQKAKPHLPEGYFRTDAGLILFSLIYNDFYKYMEKCRPKSEFIWENIPVNLVIELEKVFVNKNLFSFFKENNIDIVDIPSH